MGKIKERDTQTQQDKELIQRIIQNNRGSHDPERQLVEDFKHDIEQRIDNLAVFYPLAEILNHRNIEDGVLQLVPELCFLFLTYLIYIGKSNFRGVSFLELNEFVQYKAIPILEIPVTEDDKIKQLTNKTLDALQNDGHNYSFLTHRFSKKGDVWKYVKFVEIKRSDDGTLLYYVTDQGIDFYLRSKEFPEEAKITINLLLFQKQMEKGTYVFAYETVQRLNMAVRQKQDQRYSILKAFQNGQMEAYDTYIAYHQEIIAQGEEEKELFDVSKANIENAREEFYQKIQENDASQNDEDNYKFIQIIEGELSKTIDIHTELLSNAVGFMNDFDKELNLQREMLFVERFDFHNTFSWLSQNSQPSKLKYLFEPLLSTKVSKRFNPADVFRPQRKSVKHQTKDIIEVGIISDQPTLDQAVTKRVHENFLSYSKQILELLLQNNRMTMLGDLFDYIEEQGGLSSIYTGDLISYIIKLNDGEKVEGHQRDIVIAKDVVNIEDGMPSIGGILFEAKQLLEKKVADLFRYERLLVTSMPNEPEIDVIKGLKITNMQFELKERNR